MFGGTAKHESNHRNLPANSSMGSCCQCLFRFCFEAERDRENIEHSGANTAGLAIGERNIPVDGVLRLTAEERGIVPSNPSSLSLLLSESTSGTSAEDECCQRPLHPRHAQGLHDFFRQLKERLHGTSGVEYDRVHNRADSSTAAAAVLGTKISPPPLRAAESFDSISDIPCINASEVVLPGSELQKEMARLMAGSKLTDADEAECVICMEGFDPTNPRMPTLCGCGENKTYFHLPCLYQWIEQSDQCPSCREKLAWEEF